MSFVEQTSSFALSLAASLSGCGGTYYEEWAPHPDTGVNTLKKAGWAGAGCDHRVWEDWNPVTPGSHESYVEWRDQQRGFLYAAIRLKTYHTTSGYGYEGAWVTSAETWTWWGGWVLAGEWVYESYNTLFGPDPSPPARYESPPSTLSVQLDASWSAEKTVYDSLALAGAGPVYPGDASRNVEWVPTGDLTVAFSGTVSSSSSTAWSSIIGAGGKLSVPDNYRLTASGSATEAQAGEFPYGSDFMASSASVSGFDDDTLEWTDVIAGAPASSLPASVAHTLGGTSFNYLGKPVQKFTAVCAIHDEDGAVAAAGGLFRFQATPSDYAAPGTHAIQNHTGAVTCVGVPSGYGAASDHEKAVSFRDRAPWTGMTADRAASKAVFDFTEAFAGTDTTSVARVGSELVAVGAGAGSPKVALTLVSDFDTLAGLSSAGRDAWWADRIAAGEVSAAEQSWWTAYGKPWWMVGRKISAASHVFNWSTFGAGDLTLRADAACDVTFFVEYDEVTLSSGPTVTRTARTAEWTVAATTAATAHRLDFAKAAPHGLRHVTKVEVRFPAGRTVSLTSWDLVEVERPRLWVRHGIQSYTGATLDRDPGVLGAEERGKPVLFVTARATGTYNSRWGLHGYAPSVGYTLAAYAAVVGMQEGWTAAEGTPPAGMTPYVTDLEEVSGVALGVSGLDLTARWRGGSMFVGCGMVRSVDVELRVGSPAVFLVTHPTSGAREAASIEAERSGTPVDSGTCDGSGRGALQLKDEGATDFYASRGTGLESSLTDALVAPRTLIFVKLTGDGEDAGGRDLNVAQNPFGEPYLTEAQAGLVRGWRSSDLEATYSQHTAAAVSEVVSHSHAILADHLHLLALARAGVLIYTGTDGRNFSLLQTVDGAYVQKGVCLRVDPNGNTLRLFSVRDMGGGVGALVQHASTDAGATWSPVSMTFPPMEPDRPALAHDGDRWHLAVRISGGDLVHYTSDDAAAWTEGEHLETSNGSKPWLWVHAGRLLCCYLRQNGSQTDLAVRGAPYELGAGRTFGAAAVLQADVAPDGPAAWGNLQKQVVSYRLPDSTVAHQRSADGGGTWAAGSAG